ncbi:MAG TPA: hypothetical protein VK075_01430 [Pseudogracilibacillus sp.]|nr:hypothetical protein [Pseudogracilibacillus sp.]
MHIMSLIIGSLILSIIAGIITIYALKQEDRKIKQYQSEGHNPANDLKRSHDYEKESVSSVLPVQIWAYGICTVITLVLVIYFAVNH